MRTCWKLGFLRYRPVSVKVGAHMPPRERPSHRSLMAIVSLVLSLVVPSLAESSNQASAAPRPATMNTVNTSSGGSDGGRPYVALGDSFSSGEGNAPYQLDSDNPLSFDSCHRSNQAYGVLLNNDPTLTTALGRITFKACSGAVTEDIFSQNHNNPNGEPSQLQWLSDTTKVVTLTIGGNDVGFVNIFARCVDQFGCEKTRLRTDTANRLAALAGKGDAHALLVGTPIHSILDVLRAIHATGHAPNAKILIAGYPQFFGSSSSKYVKVSPSHRVPSNRVCVIGQVRAPIPLTSDEIPNPLIPAEIGYRDAQWIDDVITTGNNTIRTAVRQAKTEGINVDYVSPKRFDGHGFCDTRASWINPLSVINNQNTATSGSLHPNGNGQGLGYFPAFRKAVLG